MEEEVRDEVCLGLKKGSGARDCRDREDLRDDETVLVPRTGAAVAGILMMNMEDVGEMFYREIAYSKSSGH